MKKGTLFKTIVTLIPFLILIVFFGTNNVFAIKDEYNIQINSSKGIIAEKELVVEAGDIVNCAVQLETDYSLYTMNVIDGQGNSIDYTYDNNIITFQMPKRGTFTLDYAHTTPTYGLPGGKWVSFIP